jgi:hypothetical protein
MPFHFVVALPVDPATAIFFYLATLFAKRWRESRRGVS